MKCIRCKKNEAKEGYKICWECSDKYSEYYYAKASEGYKKNYDKERKKYYKRRKKDLHIAFGVCTICGKHDASEGVKTCIECRLKSKRNYRKELEKSNKVPRELFKDLGLCHICGKPVVPGRKLCEAHLNASLNNLRKAHRVLNQMDRTNHPWRLDETMGWKRHMSK